MRVQRHEAGFRGTAECDVLESCAADASLDAQRRGTACSYTLESKNYTAGAETVL